MPPIPSSDLDTIPSRIAKALRLPAIDAFHAEATEIKTAEATLQMRRVVLVTKLRESGMSWDSCGWFFGATGEAVRKFYGSLIGDSDDEPGPHHSGRPENP